MNVKTTLKYAVALPLMITHGSTLFAQKLPNEQKASVSAPAQVKIDGKAAEWGTLQAYNRATEVFYTMANDADNLYLVVQAIKPDKKADVIGKILSGGITLSIKNKEKKDSPLLVTFPLIERMKKSNLLLMIKNTNVNQDSMLVAINRELEANSKEIALAGFKEISDPKISVYNEEGIKAVSMLDAKRTWTYELKLPLKYIRHLLDANSSFDYKIIVNGVVINNEPGDMIAVSGRPIGGVSGISIVSSGSGFDAFTPTDLSATYTLAKK